jgi:phosphonoacetaldehyde hydrolase
MNFRYQRRYHGPVKGVIFDWAGTTVDHGCLASATTFVEAFKGAGIGLSVAEARAPMGLAKWHHIQALIRLPSVAEAWRARYGATPGDADVEQIYRRFLPLQVETVARHSDVIEGVVDAVAQLRVRGLKIGSTTGYPREVTDVVCKVAAAQGYTPDCVVCAADTRLGRPGPYMVFKAMIDLELSPVEAVVKVGDTVVDIEEGLNAGLWAVGVAATGNEMGLTAADLAALAADQRRSRLAAARARLYAAGAHYVIDRVGDLPAVIDDIDDRLARGDRP